MTLAEPRDVREGRSLPLRADTSLGRGCGWGERILFCGELVDAEARLYKLGPPMKLLASMVLRSREAGRARRGVEPTGAAPGNGPPGTMD